MDGREEMLADRGAVVTEERTDDDPGTVPATRTGRDQDGETR